MDEITVRDAPETERKQTSRDGEPDVPSGSTPNGNRHRRQDSRDGLPGQSTIGGTTSAISQELTQRLFAFIREICAALHLSCRTQKPVQEDRRNHADCPRDRKSARRGALASDELNERQEQRHGRKSVQHFESGHHESASDWYGGVRGQAT